MRILLACDYFDNTGGAETYAKNLHQLLLKRGHDVKVISDRWRVIHYVSRIFNPWYLVKFIWIIFKWNPHVIHVQQYSLVHSFTPALAGKICGKPVFLTLHDVGLFCPEGWGLRRDGALCEKNLSWSCFAVKCLRSKNLKWDMHRKFNFIKNSVQIFFHKISVHKFYTPSRSITQWARFHFGERVEYLPYFVKKSEGKWPFVPCPEGLPLKIFYAGRLVEHKGLQFVMEEIKGLPVQLHVAGIGPYEKELKRLAKNSDVEAQVLWMGQIPEMQVHEELLRCHLAVLPSLWIENLPLFALSAMKMGRGLLVSDIGGLPDMVEEKINGRLFKCPPSGQIFDILQEVTQHMNICTQWGMASQNLAAKRFGEDGLYKRMEENYLASLPEAGHFQC